jgi:protease-4
MSLETDLLLDRRRLKRRLIFWRSFTVLALVVAALVVLRGSGFSIGRAHLARLTVDGVISDDRNVTEAVYKLANDPEVKALIVSIDSPGGSVAGGEALHDAIAQVAAKKPVVAVMRGLAASAGYMIAVPASRIFARDSTLTGSIGVLLETGDMEALLGKIGIATDAIVSGPLKDQPSYTKPLSEQGRAVLQGLVMDMYDMFVGMVASGRHMPPERIRELADGRAYTGRQALKLGLVDEIGGERQARAWLAAKHGIADTLPVTDVSTTTLAQRTILGTFGPIFDGLWKAVISQSVTLDGGLAIWQRSGR